MNVGKVAIAICIIVVVIIILASLTGYLNGQGLGLPTQTSTTKTMTSTTIPSIIPTMPTDFEKLEITNGYAQNQSAIVIDLKNTGPKDATVTDILVNGKPLNQADITGSVTPAIPIPLKTGDSIKITIIFSSTLNTGVTYDIKIHTASDNDYTKSIIAQ